jgi:hypothetical protein
MRRIVVLLACFAILFVPWILLPTPCVSGVSAADDLLDINTASGDQLKAPPRCANGYAVFPTVGMHEAAIAGQLFSFERL